MRDPLLSWLKLLIQSSWPAAVEPNATKTLLIASLGIYSGRWMHCVGVSCCCPNSRETVCYNRQQLHEDHPCDGQMKGLARMHTWWPQIDEDKAVGSCPLWQKIQLHWSKRLSSCKVAVSNHALGSNWTFLVHV